MKEKNKELTRAELQIMQILWDKQEAFVNDIICELSDPKPAYNTVSTIVRILEKKGFVGHTPIGKGHRYHPLIAREEYMGGYMNSVLNNFFGSSVSKMVSFFSERERIPVSEMDEIMEIISRNKQQK